MTKRRRCMRSIGLTLVEVLIVSGITLFMLGALAGLYRSFAASYDYGRATQGVTEPARAALRAVEELAPSADRILASRAFSAGTYASGAHALVLEIPAVDASGATVSGEYDYAAIYQEGATAYETVEASAGSARHSKTAQFGNVLLSFSYDNADPAAAATITMLAVATTTAHGAVASTSLESTVRLRNR